MNQLIVMSYLLSILNSGTTIYQINSIPILIQKKFTIKFYTFYVQKDI